LTTYCPLSSVSKTSAIQATYSNTPATDTTAAVPVVSTSASSESTASEAADVSTYEGAAVKFGYSSNLMAAAAALLLL